jgi:D-glycero-alpha-D-manno-heptose 1-phosphate guanylyltransferase
MQAVILAGGLGTRLRAAVPDVPKALAPIAGQPFLEYQIRLVQRCGFTQLVLCVGAQHQLIESVLGTGDRLGVEIAYSREDQPLGTGGALFNARALLADTFIVLNGDTYFDTDLAALPQARAFAQLPAAMALVQVADVSRYGSVTLDLNQRVAQFTEKGHSGPGLINAGVYAFSHQVFDDFTAQYPISLERDVFPQLASRRLLGGHIMTGYHIDIGLPDSYAQFQHDVQKGLVA